MSKLRIVVMTYASKPAEHENAVVFACDYGHFPLAMFAANRILRVEPGPFDVVIALPDVSQVGPEWRDSAVRICEIDVSSLAKVPMLRDWISFGTYFRWVLPEYFSGEYERFLYLDTDTYLRRPGIQGLFSQVRPEFSVCAATELIAYSGQSDVASISLDKKRSDLGGANGEYYNAGVLLIQLEPFLAGNGTQRFQNAVLRNQEFDPIHTEQDQGALNLAFADEIVPLSPLYNWRTGQWMNERFVQEYDPVILHFAGNLKPWEDADQPFYRAFVGEYRDFLRSNFPNFEIKASRGSVAWRQANPKHKFKVFEQIRTALYLRRQPKKWNEKWFGGDLQARRAIMDEALAAAVIT